MEALAALLKLLLWLAVVASSLAQQRPRCRRQCGNVTIPYPFGIGAGCHHGATANGFRLRCDARRRRLTVSRHLGPQGRGHRAPQRQPRVLRPTRREHPMALNGSAFLFSSMKSKFVAIGCPGLSYFLDGGGDYVTGCMSVCRPSERALPGSCRGDDGCCQSNIPLGLDSYRPRLGSFRARGQETTFLENSTACSYAFMVDAIWFWLAGSHFNRTGDFAVPVVLDWAIRDRRAERRRHGNPYVTDGCSDVNECERRDEFLCYGVCINTPGSFICTCPKGSSGNATVQHGCRPDTKFTTALKAVTGVSVGVFMLLLVCFSAHVCLQKRRLLRAKQRFFEQNGGLLLQQQLGTLASAGVAFSIFSEEEIGRATDGFAEARVLGRGVVYKGVLPDGSSVAVKRSRMVDARQVREFAREMLILSQINHRHVVKLVGCCLEVEVPMLVYEYVPNGNLSSHIHGGGVLLPPAARLRVAAESADALAYMHSSASPPILHRDVKSANILLDGDLGASRLAPAVATMVHGTLELLTGRKAFVPVEDEEEDEEGSLAFWFLAAAHQGRHREIMDRWVGEELGVEVIDEAAELGGAVPQHGRRG
ncbi:hypothetical protein QOZ80_4BG0346160 [Eleusine coracana subsp. coracana]|nr:hypothetical protein QOZ80_4BG0346160 [Eleusine coracana subsp. coracana]